MAVNHTFKNGDVFRVRWTGTVKPELAGVQGMRPLYLAASAMTPTIDIDLYASRSNAFPHESKDGWWKNLLPTWKFYDDENNVITRITASGKKVPSLSGDPVLSGMYVFEASARFANDLPTDYRKPTYLWAVMELSGCMVEGENCYESYANSNVLDAVEVKTAGIWPDEILYTIDGKTPLSAEYHWADQIVPFIGIAHSSYYDTDYIASDKHNTLPGVIYDFPNTSAVAVPFLYTNKISTEVVSAASEEPLRHNGKIVMDDEGVPVPAYYETSSFSVYAPIVAYETEEYELASAVTETSSTGGEPETPIPDSIAVYKAPTFRLYDDRKKNHFYTGGYFIANATTHVAGKHPTITSFEGSASNQYSNDSYLPPYAIWASAPYEGVLYRAIPEAKLDKVDEDELRSIGVTSKTLDWGSVPPDQGHDNGYEIAFSGMEHTPSHQELDDEGIASAYHISGVQGIYSMCVDINYNLWCVDEELAKLYLFSPYGETLSSMDLNDLFWEAASGDTLAQKYFGNGTSAFDKAKCGLQPSYISITPELAPRLTIAYHNSYLVTTHDALTGKVIGYDYSNPIGYRGDRDEIEDNFSKKGFHAHVDNANKPTVIANGEDGSLWVGYSSTSVGMDDDYVKIDEENESKVCLYEDGEIDHRSASTLSYKFLLGTNVLDMCPYKESLYVLTENEDGDCRFVRLYKLPGGNDLGSEDIIPLGTMPTLKNPNHITISSDGKCWFHYGKRNLFCYDTVTEESYDFDWDRVRLYELNDKLQVSDEYQELDGMSIDTDDYLWIIDNFAKNNLQRIDSVKLLEWAKSQSSSKPTEIADGICILDNPATGPNPDGRRISPKGEFGKTQDKWSQYRLYDSTVDVPFVVANGDWTGIKLQNAFNNVKPDYCIGKSGTLYNLNYDRFRFRKYNESWDTVDNMKKNILVSKFREASESFWNEYAQSMIGGVDNHSYPMGRRLYERIANIVPNLHDIEDSTIDGLYSMAKAQDVPLNSYDLHFPEAVQRMADLFSCRHERIWGERCPCTENYTEQHKAAMGIPGREECPKCGFSSWNYVRNSEGTEKKVCKRCGWIDPKYKEAKTCFCPSCGHWHKSNLGEKFDISEKNLLTDKTPYIVRNPMDSNSIFQKIVPTENSVRDAALVLQKIESRTWNKNDSDIFYRVPENFAESIMELTNENARLMAIHTQFYVTDLWYNFCFWKFRGTECGVQNIGLVHWDDRYTTFPESLSGIEEFYKEPDTSESQPNGYAPLVFNWLLHNGLMFGKDGYKE